MTADIWGNLSDPQMGALANICLGMIGFVWLLLRTSSRWEEYPREVHMLLIMTAALFFSLLLASVEMFVALDQPLVRTVIVISIAKVTALYVLWSTRETKYRTGPRCDDDDVNPDEDI